MMLLKYIISLLLTYSSLTTAETSCQEGDRHCICHDDSDYYTTQQCYTSNKPWGDCKERIGRVNPDSPSKQKISFQCYSIDNPDEYQVLKLNENLPINYDPSKTTIFMVHGFLSSADEKSWIIQMKNEFIKNGYDYNLCAIDWSNGANVGTFNLDYPKAAQNTRVVGDVTANLIDWLSEHYNSKNSNFICIGHSLGAHICGYTGKNVKNGPLKRISGLDPAGPFFENLSSEVRLDKNDASYVDSIHTDGKKLYQAGFGMLQNISHTDFYPNGGYNQPGCNDVIHIGCSHGRACELYISSIGKKSCNAYPCGNANLHCQKCDWSERICYTCQEGQYKKCQQMGWHSYDSQDEGEYYLETGGDCPYC